MWPFAQALSPNASACPLTLYTCTVGAGAIRAAAGSCTNWPLLRSQGQEWRDEQELSALVSQWLTTLQRMLPHLQHQAHSPAHLHLKETVEA